MQLQVKPKCTSFNKIHMLSTDCMPGKPSKMRINIIVAYVGHCLDIVEAQMRLVSLI